MGSRIARDHVRRRDRQKKKGRGERERGDSAGNGNKLRGTHSDAIKGAKAAKMRTAPPPPPPSSFPCVGSRDEPSFRNPLFIVSATRLREIWYIRERREALRKIMGLFIASDIHR